MIPVGEIARADDEKTQAMTIEINGISRNSDGEALRRRSCFYGKLLPQSE